MATSKSFTCARLGMASLLSSPKGKDLDLTKILKICPKGTKLYTPIYGEMDLEEVTNGDSEVFPIVIFRSDVGRCRFTKYGQIYNNSASECLLFPSKDNRDWSTFKIEQPKQEFEPFQKVLVRNDDKSSWIAGYYSHFQADDDFPFFCVGSKFKQCIPYDGNEGYLGTIFNPNIKSD